MQHKKSDNNNNNNSSKTRKEEGERKMKKEVSRKNIRSEFFTFFLHVYRENNGNQYAHLFVIDLHEQKICIPGE